MCPEPEIGGNGSSRRGGERERAGEEEEGEEVLLTAYNK